MEVVRWFLSGLGCVTDQTISKKARQPLSLIIWPSPPNSMLGIAPCSDRWCCSLREVRRGHRAVSRQGLQKRSPTASVFLLLQTQMAKQLAMLVWWVFCFLFFFFCPCKIVMNTFYINELKMSLTWQEAVFLMLWCNGSSASGSRRGGFFWLWWRGPQFIWYAPCCSSVSLPALSHISQPLKHRWVCQCDLSGTNRSLGALHSSKTRYLRWHWAGAVHPWWEL